MTQFSHQPPGVRNLQNLGKCHFQRPDPEDIALDQKKTREPNSSNRLHWQPVWRFRLLNVGLAGGRAKGKCACQKPLAFSERHRDGPVSGQIIIIHQSGQIKGFPLNLLNYLFFVSPTCCKTTAIADASHPNEVKLTKRKYPLVNQSPLFNFERFGCLW